MALPAARPCPRCNHTPDLPADLFISRRKNQAVACFCNYCGTKLHLKLAASGTFKVHATCAAIRGFHQESSLTPFVRVGDLAPDDIQIAIWTDPRKKVFISYSHKDDSWCNTFAESLKQHDLDIFCDSNNHSIRSGADWIREIGQAIDECHIFLIVLTPNSWSSQWVQQELNVAFAARREIMPLLLKETRVQGLLRSVQWTDVRGRTPTDAATLLSELLQTH